MVVASRRVDATDWTYTPLDEHVAWDSHDTIAMAFDAEGYLHVAGNMHSGPLRYYRTSRPDAASDLTPIHAMTGANERSGTYPVFLRGPGGALLFMYRDGRAGKGRVLVNVYDTGRRTWTRVSATPLLDGEGGRSAYLAAPLPSPMGLFQLAWVWRDTSDCSTNHDVSYASDLGSGARRSDGTVVALPLTLRSAEIVDPVPVRSGLMNSVQLSTDAAGRTLVTYCKFDENGHTEIYTARREAGGWVVHRTTDWNDRWELAGTGTIVDMIAFSAPTPWPDGSLAQVFVNRYHSPRRWIRFLDGCSLQPRGRARPLYPAPLEDAAMGRPRD